MLRTLAICLALATPVAAFPADVPASEQGVDYRIGPRDVLQVQVYGEEDLSGDVTVDGDGRMFVPLVGVVDVAGLSPQEAGAALTARLADGYFVAPQVSIEVKEYKSQKVALVGAVRRPGEYYLTGPTSLMELLARAGNIDAEKSAREVRVRRESGETIVISLDALLAQGEGDLLLQRGDIVTVPEGQFVYVAGDVAKPGAVTFWEGLTVTQALTKAGGPAQTAQLRGAYILRGGEKIGVNLKRVLGGRDADIELEPGDQLFLRQSPI